MTRKNRYCHHCDFSEYISGVLEYIYKVLHDKKNPYEINP
jgi:hypothetical protein